MLWLNLNCLHFQLSLNYSDRFVIILESPVSINKTS